MQNVGFLMTQLIWHLNRVVQFIKLFRFFAEYAKEIDNKPPRGRVSHVAATAYGNLLLVAGGFSGYVRGDLVAFKFPSYVAPPQVSMQFKQFARFV